MANSKTKGFCQYKAINGIKRHLLVDVLGNPYFVRYTKASLSDDGLLAIIKENKQYFGRAEKTGGDFGLQSAF